MNRLRFLSSLIACATLAGVPQAAMACGVVRNVCATPAYVAPQVAYVAPTYATPLIASYALLVPAFAIGTYPTPAPAVVATPVNADLEKRFGRLEGKFDRLLEQLSSPKLEALPAPKAVPAPVPQGKPAAAAPQPAGDTPLVLGMRNCFQCHATGSLAKGTTFRMFSSRGDSFPFEDAEVKNILEHIDDGRMPKGSKLPEDQRQAIHQLLDPENRLAKKDQP